MKQRKVTAMVLAFTMCLAMLLTGCGSGDSNTSVQSAAGKKAPSEVLVLRVGDDEIYLNEVNYYALSMIKGMGVPEGTDMSQHYSADYPTMDDAFKAQLLAQIRQSKILYLKAVEEGITLTAEEEEEMNGLIDEFIASSDQEQLDKFGLDKEVLTKIYTQVGLIRKLELQIADQIKADDVGYGTAENLVFLRVELDENGNAIVNEDGSYSYLSEEEQEQQRQLAEEALERLKNGEEPEDLIQEYGLEETSGTIHGTTDSMREAYGLADGEISEIIENDYSYTIVKMTKLEDTEYTETIHSYQMQTAAQEAIEEQENAWFNEFSISEDDLEQDVWEAFTFQDFL